MKKICMLSTGHTPMDDRIFYKEVLSLAKRYEQIVLLMPGRKEDFPGGQPGIRYIPLRQSGSLLARFFLLPGAVAAVLKSRPSVCHFHDFELIFILPFLRVFSGCRIIYDVHEAYPEMVLGSAKVPRLLRPFLARLADVTEKLLARYAHCVIAADDNIAGRFTGSNRCMQVIFNYPRQEIFIPDEKKTSLLGEKYRGKTPIIYQGSMSEQRGLFQMIRSMSIIKRKRPEIVLLLIGGIRDDLMKRVRDEVKALDLQDVVETLGWVPHEEIVNYICVSRVGLVPLLPTEKFMKNIPIKQFEYMACGVPVLGANLPPIASCVAAAGCGKLFDSTDPGALAAGVLEILGDEAEWRRMSEAGKKAVRELWNWDRMEERLLSVYADLLGETG
jgi:glycosyltransferase involved in cell wall biosynthesis